MEKDWILLSRFGKLYIAEMLKELLHSNNIEAVVIDKIEKAYGAGGFVEVYVNKNDKDAANKFLKEFNVE